MYRILKVCILLACCCPIIAKANKVSHSYVLDSIVEYRLCEPFKKTAIEYLSDGRIVEKHYLWKNKWTLTRIGVMYEKENDQEKYVALYPDSSLMYTNYVKYNKYGDAIQFSHIYSSNNIPSKKVEINYNSEKKIESEIEYHLCDGKWTAVEKVEYNYDDEHHTSLSMYSLLNEHGEWKASSKEETAYNDNGTIRSYAIYGMSNGEWKGHYAYKAAYDDSGKMTVKQHTMKYSDDWDWDSCTESHFLYDNYGNLCQTVSNSVRSDSKSSVGTTMYAYDTLAEIAKVKMPMRSDRLIPEDSDLRLLNDLKYRILNISNVLHTGAKDSDIMFFYSEK